MSEISKILVVDDEAEILTALEDLFEDDYEVISTLSPELALEILRQEAAISVIISDQRMPDLSGDQFLARARLITKAPAILLTGYADINAVISAINTGWVAGYVHKPWDPEVLRTMVANAHQRHMLQSALDLERALLHGLMENSGNAMSFKNMEGRFVRLNALKARSMGVTVKESLGQHEGQFVAPVRAAELDRAEAAVMDSQRPIEIIEEQQDHSNDGSSRWFAVSRFPVLDDGRLCTHVGTIHREITEQRNMEERLRQADKMEALGTLAGGIAHDFNNLLMIVLGNLDLAARKLERDNPSVEGVTRNLDNAAGAAKRGAALTNRLLSFSRRKEMRTVPVDLNEIIRGMSNLLERTLGGVNTLEVQLGEGLWLTHGDPEQLELAILNLCINARDAMRDGGIITVTTENLPGNGQQAGEPSCELVRLVVRDTGRGMSPLVQRRAIEPFFTTKAANGTGLGLSMVYGMAQQLGGTVTIDSEEDVGTSIDVRLPRAARENAGTHATQGQVVAGPGRSIHVVLVDDDDAVREVTAAHLLELGHRLDEAADGAGALEILDRLEAVDLLVADFAMPGMTGMELAVRARMKTPHLPVLIVTGHAALEVVPDGIAVLEKPFTAQQLSAAITELLAVPRQDQEA